MFASILQEWLVSPLSSSCWLWQSTILSEIERALGMGARKVSCSLHGFVWTRKSFLFLYIVYLLITGVAFYEATYFTAGLCPQCSEVIYFRRSCSLLKSPGYQMSCLAPKRTRCICVSEIFWIYCLLLWELLQSIWVRMGWEEGCGRS